MLSARDIVRAIADAASRWSDADFPARVRATQRVAERTGYSIPVVEYAFDRLFFSITQEALTATIEDELGGLDILDEFMPRQGRTDAWAQPIGNVCIISSRTTIGVALPAAIFALCAKCDVLVKDREDSLVAGFFETLCEEDEHFRNAARAEAWSSDDSGIPDLRSFDMVVAFGRDETLEQIRGALNPEARFAGFGSRASAGYITREALSDAAAAKTIARGAARDLVLYETEGCLSLHILFAENGGRVSVAAFSEFLEKEIEDASVEFPRAENPARVVQARALAAFRSAVAVPPPVLEAPQFLPRTLSAIAVDAPAEALEYLRRHAIPLEGFAIAGDRDDVNALAIAAGAVRLSGFGELQHPPLHGNHGGRPCIADFVKWVDKTF
ncbi:MAG TPA: acyl-CoA reductase [Candidatus Rubrimentiphilum sp.]|nr:acyl-CoA reductase [Candidatus Rubrimentiphilum sp.]